MGMIRFTCTRYTGKKLCNVCSFLRGINPHSQPSLPSDSLTTVLLSFQLVWSWTKKISQEMWTIKQVAPFSQTPCLLIWWRVRQRHLSKQQVWHVHVHACMWAGHPTSVQGVVWLPSSTLKHKVTFYLAALSDLPYQTPLPKNTSELISKQHFI